MDEYPIIDLSHLLPAAQGLARLPADERIQRTVQQCVGDRFVEAGDDDSDPAPLPRRDALELGHAQMARR